MFDKMFDKIRASLGSNSTAITTTGSAAAPASATIPGVRADLIEIKVNGIDAAKAAAVWLTKGLDRGPATCVLLTDCTTDHLKNIVVNKPDLSADYLRVIEAILADRGETLPADDDSQTSTDPFAHLS
jgi:hypothetical protein